MTWWNGVVEAVTETWEGFRTRPNLRQAYLKVQPEQAEAPRRFEAEKSYATIRIVELRLAEAGRYTTQYLPMCACFLREGTGEEARTIPVVIGAETIRGGLGGSAPKDAGRNLAIVNMDLVRTMPVRSGGLTLYTSLCRFPDNALTEGLLGFAAEAAKAIGGEALAAPVRVTGDLTGKLQTLLGAKDVETRFARLDGDALQESGFRLLAASSKPFAGPLHVRDGVLMAGPPGRQQSVDDVDYLLLEFRHVPTLVDAEFSEVRRLPFHRRFEEIEQEVIKARGKPSPVVDDLVIKLEQEVYASPALVRRDRIWLTQVYAAARRQLETSFAKVTMSGEEEPEISALRARQSTAETPAVAEALQQLLQASEAVMFESGPGPAKAPSPPARLAEIGRLVRERAPLEDADDAVLEATAVAQISALRARR